MQQIPAGSQLGEYVIGEQLGEGGMGAVYQAFRAGSSEKVALKVLLPELSHDDDYRQRFQREITMMTQLSHPNIIPIYGHGEDKGMMYFVMYLVRGKTVMRLLHERRFSPKDAHIVLAPIADALDYAHAREIIHRDIKPANIMLSTAGDRRVYLTDFGLGKLLSATAITQAGLKVGTPEYMSPEQVLDQPYTAATDVYCLGVVLYEMLLGRVPFSGKRPEQIAFKHVEDMPPKPTTINPDFPLGLEAVVMQALEKDAAHRYPSAGALARAYTEALGELSSDDAGISYWP